MRCWRRMNFRLAMKTPFERPDTWPGNYFHDRQQWMDNVVKHTSQAFMGGITMGCVKCHDHMYDPFPQEDYYAMRAIFEPYRVRTDHVPGELDLMNGGIPRAYDATIEAKTYLFERGRRAASSER